MEGKAASEEDTKTREEVTDASITGVMVAQMVMDPAPTGLISITMIPPNTKTRCRILRDRWSHMTTSSDPGEKGPTFT
jgi:hypothetical protein